MKASTLKGALRLFLNLEMRRSFQKQGHQKFEIKKTQRCILALFEAIFEELGVLRKYEIKDAQRCILTLF